MAQRTPGLPGMFLGLLCFVMTFFAVIVIGVLRRNSLSLRLCLMALLAHLSGGLVLLPRMVAFQTILYQCIRMLLMGKLHLPLRDVKGDFILCSENTGSHQDGEHKPHKDPDAN